MSDDNELEEIWMEAVVAQPWYYPGISLEGLRKPRITSVRISGFPTEIQTYLLLHTSLVRYGYFNLI
jgi:hypothetical protein